MKKQLELGGPLTRRESDAGLLMLALAGLPRAGVPDDDMGSVRAIYFELLHKAGMTGAMLKSACERFIMRPTNGKPKFFPDPGQLVELCRDEIEDRRKALAALTGAVALLEAPVPLSEAENLISLDRMRQIRQAAEAKRVGPSKAATRGAQVRSATLADIRDQLEHDRDPQAVAALKEITERMKA